MKKYFIMSDIHSFYEEMQETLNNVGFDANNEEHIFVLCGDLFDRGNGSKDLYKFIKELPKERRILVRGNHEYLLKDLLEKNFPEGHDFSNGTVKTICDMVDADWQSLRYNYLLDLGKDITPYDYWQQIKDKFKKLKIIEWIFETDEWVNYFELGNLICVHSFIPLNDDSSISAYYDFGHNYSYKNGWRTSSASYEWEDATWGCPWKLFCKDLFKEESDKGKILVVGHWHTSDFHSVFEKDCSEDNFEIYLGDNLIALDGCTALTHQVNVLVVEEQEDGYQLKDRFNNDVRFIPKGA